MSYILERPVEVSNMKPSFKGPNTEALPLASNIEKGNN